MVHGSYLRPESLMHSALTRSLSRDYLAAKVKMVDKYLASALQLPDDCADEVNFSLVLFSSSFISQSKDISSAIVALLTSADHDAKPRSSLSEIYQLLTNLCATSYLVRTSHTS